MKYIIDLDGTLMNGEQPNKDSVFFINELQKQGQACIIMTNSMKSPAVINWSHSEHAKCYIAMKSLVI